jgi:hypothetical protein
VVAVLGRVALLVLAVLLLVTTAYLVIQVRSGPRSAGDAAARSPAPDEGDPGDDSDEGDDRRDRDRGDDRRAREDGRDERVAGAAAEAGGAGRGAPPATAPGSSVDVAANLSFDEANKLYDRREYDEARALALTLLRDHPTSVRMRRVVVASSCIMGDHDVAQQHYLLLPERDRSDMRQRCVPYGAAFHE